MSPLVSILIAVIAAVFGCVGGYAYRKQTSEKKIGRTEEYVQIVRQAIARRQQFSW